MSTDACRTLPFGNTSLLSQSNRPSINHITEWILLTISSLIFLLAFIGNIAALTVTLAPRGLLRLGNGRYLANLAIADSFRTCLIPFTIIARMKRNFIFGPSMCRILPVAQGNAFDPKKDSLLTQTNDDELISVGLMRLYRGHSRP